MTKAGNRGVMSASTTVFRFDPCASGWSARPTSWSFTGRRTALATLPGRIQAGEAEGRRLRHGPALRPGDLPGGDARRAIPGGALFYGRTRRRLDVAFDEALAGNEETARVHALIASGQTPPPVYEKRCESCSLLAECLPKTIQKRRSVKSYLARILEELRFNMERTGRYDISGLVEGQFEPGSRGRVLRNLIAINRKREMDAIESNVLRTYFRKAYSCL